jgi:site-specific DNA-methyltransferase (cytosine-N4-specific)
VIICGDARRLPLKDRSVQCTITSPPYFGQRNYHVVGQIGLEQTPAEYVAAMVEVFREVRRILRDDGTLWLVIGDSYSHAGRGHRDAERWPKQAGNGHFPPRCKERTGLKRKDLLGMPWRVAFALQEDGWTLRSAIVWQKPCCLPEPVKDRPTRSYDFVFLLAKSAARGRNYYYNAAAIAEPTSPGEKRRTGARTRNCRDVWTIDADRNRSDPTRRLHFAAFPKKLVERCILAGSRPGDLVFEPFLGSGTVGVVAERRGRRWVGLDLNEEYVRLVHEASRRRANETDFAADEGESAACA